MKRAFVAFCETCQWVGLVRSDETESIFPFSSRANTIAREDLAMHFDTLRHDRDKPRKEGENIYSVGVQDMMVRDLTAIEKLQAFLT